MLGVDDVRPILVLLRRRKLRIDPMYAGELRRLFDEPRVRRQFYSRFGMLVDECGEAMWSAGFTVTRPSCNEVLDLLETLFSPRVRARGRVRPTARELSAEERRARDNRQKKFQCPDCQQIVRASRNASVLCGVCYEIDGKIVPMVRVEPTVAEVLERMAS